MLISRSIGSQSWIWLRGPQGRPSDQFGNANRERIIAMTTIFTAWGYQVSYLELASVVVSVIAVTLGALGRRIAWPWWVLSSVLYGIFFAQVDLFASALLQLVFIAAAIWGWFGWQPSGVAPRYLSKRERFRWSFVLLSTWVIAAPVLANIGAAASWPDSFLLVASTIAQILMVLQRNESWVLWLIVNVFATFHYARQDLWFTSLLYLLFAFIALFGLIKWRRIKA